MSFFVSKEIKQLIDVNEHHDDNKAKNKIINVNVISSNEKNVILQFYDYNRLKKNYEIDCFTFCKKKYKFNKKVKFELLSLKKENTNIAVEIFICKHEFWRYLENEE